MCETAQGGVGTYLGLLGAMPAGAVRHRAVAPSQNAAMLGGTAFRGFHRPRRGIRALVAMIGALLAERRAARPDIYMFHSSFALLGLVVLRLLRDRTPTIYCAHGWAATNHAEGTWRARAARAVEGRLCGLATAVVNVSAAEHGLAERHGYRGRHLTIENAVRDIAAPVADPVAADRFAGEPGALHLLFIGRFDRQKGLDLLLRAFARARAARDDLRLHVIGAAVRDGAPRPAVPAGVTVSDWVDPAEIDGWYAAADALLVPSRWEGLPLVIPEALRNGTPVFCSDRSGMPDLVAPGKTGGCFAPEVAAIEACLTGLDKSALRAMRPDCRRAYETRFAVDRLHAELTALFRELAEAER